MPAEEWALGIARRCRARKERDARSKLARELTGVLVLLFLALLVAATIFGCWR